MVAAFTTFRGKSKTNYTYANYLYDTCIPGAYVVPNFTENGWGLTKAPDGLVDELRQALKVGIEEGPGLEASALGAIEIESEASHPLFVDTDSLNEKV